MKRLASVLLFLGIAVLVFGSVILYMEKAARQRANDVASTRFIRVYTDMPADFIQTVGQAFARKETSLWFHSLPVRYWIALCVLIIWGMW